MIMWVRLYIKAMTQFIRSIFFFNLPFLNNIFIIKTKVYPPRT
jgi:hypothetical protein